MLWPYPDPSSAKMIFISYDLRHFRLGSIASLLPAPLTSGFPKINRHFRGYLACLKVPQRRKSQLPLIPHHALAGVARVTLENSPSKVAAADQPFSHFISADAVVSAESCACDAPLTTKLAPGSDWKVAAIDRSGSKSCAQAKRPRSVSIAVRQGKGIVGAKAEFAAGIGDVLGAISECKNI